MKIGPAYGWKPIVPGPGPSIAARRRPTLRRSVLALWFFAAAIVPALGETGPACADLSGLIPVEGGPLFLPSYPTAEPGPIRGVAFLYDDAVAAIALVGCGQAGKARRIGDAMLAALDGDRFWHDGRLRNAYAAGPVTARPVKLGGWWEPTQQRWLEDRYQVGSDSGNLAWAVLALVALDRAFDQGDGDRRYRDGAVAIGRFLAGRADGRGAGGYTGGFSGWEPAPTADLWKSTEHNTDLAAAFAALAQTTGDAAWTARAEAAARFVAAMWDDERSVYGVGTLVDGVTRNPIVALDAAIWPLLALPGTAQLHAVAVRGTIADRLAVQGGYGYSDHGKGLWTEGTAQAALLHRLLGHGDEADALIAIVEAQRAPGGGYFATPADALDTGFADPVAPGQDRRYYHLPHLAAAAWAALAERGFNPFTGTTGLP
jgi:hypothetical protein